ncbi:MAG: hypothetical protein ACRDSN_05500 [Pseudonocardiaceae bacterium]
MADHKPKEKADRPVHRREFRLPTGIGMESGAPVVKAEALARGLRPTGEAFIESDTDDGKQRVIVWAVPVAENVS